MGSSKQHIVVSAVNLRKGGTLTVLCDCLSYLSTRDDIVTTALVHDRSLCDYPRIEYIEIPWSIKGWGRRLWCEYVTMNGISKKMDHIPDLWFSLHDTTPRVRAKSQAVYCHTSFPFLKRRWRDFRMDKKIPLFSMFTKFAYKWFSKRNDYLVVQQEWFRNGLSDLIHFPKDRIIVSPPSFKPLDIPCVSIGNSGKGRKDYVVERGNRKLFFYPSTPDCHKNFELVCEAVYVLEKKYGPDCFRVVFTFDGTENKYASWLINTWGGLNSIDWHGYMSKEDLVQHYADADCLVFTSRIETWGLPISEFKVTDKPMILSDLPYAHETASGFGSVAFCGVDDSDALATMIEEVITGKMDSFEKVPVVSHASPYARSWEELFGILLGANT